MAFALSRSATRGLAWEVPYLTFKARTRIRGGQHSDGNPFEWVDYTTDDYFKGKRCVLFALPGAFFPTCSFHLREYEIYYDGFKDLGIDEVYCLSVNDAFVMRKWGIDVGLEEDLTPGSLGFKNVKLIPDGTCEFTQAMGMNCTWTTELGLGERSWRYSAYIEDCVIKQIFVEQPMIGHLKRWPKEEPFEVSDAKTMLNYLKEYNLDI